MKTKLSTREFREKHKTLLNSFHSPRPSFWGMLYLAKGYRYYSLNFSKKKVYLPILRKMFAILGPKYTLLEGILFNLWTTEKHVKAPFLWVIFPYSLYTCRSHSFEILIFSHDALGWQKDNLPAQKCQLSWQANSISMQCLHSTVEQQQFTQSAVLDRNSN